jgi:uncharacterized membrane protein
MKLKYMKNLANHITFGLNCLLVFLACSGKVLAIPIWLQVFGRMHPLWLHFPIVLLLMALVWNLFVQRRTGDGSASAQNETGDWILLSAAFTAAVSALTGLFLSQEQGYDADAIRWHKWTGIAVSLLALGGYGFRDWLRRSGPLALFMSGASLLAVVMAGHQGAGITHGAGFLWAPLNPPNEGRHATADDAVIFEDLVKPILEKKCISCHNNGKAKGELVMETPEQLLKGGKSGPLWDEQVAGPGLLMQRIYLPLEDKKHMPPSGKPQLTPEEIAILHHWIKSGADFTKKIKELTDTDSLKIWAQSNLKTHETTLYPFEAANEATIKKLNTNYRVITPLALGSPALSVDFFGASQFKSTQLEDLQDIKTQIVQLNLNKMPIRDEDLKSIANFENLRKLNLSFTRITGAGLTELRHLKHLKQLSLSGTGVKSAELEVLKDMPALKVLQLWNTGVSAGDLMDLQVKLPGKTLEMGFNGDTISARLSMPILENDEIQVFRQDTRVKLKHPVKGTLIRYTLDGSDPDSLSSHAYTEEGIMIDKTALLKAKAFLEGWISSDTLVQQFYKSGFIPDSVRLTYAPNPQYAGKGKKLFDDKLGDKNFKSGKWLGFRETPFEGYAYFTQPVTLSKLTFSGLLDIGSYIMPPLELQVWGGNSLSDLVLLKTMKPQQPSKVEPAVLRGFECSFNPKTVKVLKWVAKPVAKLPAWHPGKGDKGWFFVDEIFLN